MKKLIIYLLLVLFVFELQAQVYKDNKTRHRFAQLTIGYDYITSFGGNSAFRNLNEISPFNLNGRQSHRLQLGGTHFWGHADFYFAVYSLSSANGTNSTDNFFSSHSNGFETVFKYYPIQIQHNKLRPFMGTGVIPYSFFQRDKTIEFGSGENLTRYRFPLIGGLTYNFKNHLINLTGFYNYSNSINYYISRDQAITVNTPPLYLSIGYKYSLDASKSLEKNWESGETQTLTKELRNKKQLNGLFFGVGVTTAYGLGKSSYNTNNRPYLTDKFDSGFAADVSLGYFISKPELSININWRKYRSRISAFGTSQNTNRTSFALELSHGLLDYHGFVPFIGPIFSLEYLRVRESHENSDIFDITKNKPTVGLLFGWDIKLSHMEWWHLRTNLRYFPFLQVEAPDESTFSFNNLEFNFIQVIVYPNRIFLKKNKKKLMY